MAFWEPLHRLVFALVPAYEVSWPVFLAGCIAALGLTGQWINERRLA